MPEAAERKLLEIGTDAPDFTLIASYGDPVTLSEYRGRMNVCLFFYPGDDTPGCTRQLCAARDEAEKFVAADMERFGVNPGSLESHQRFAQKYELDYLLLVDADLAVAEAYGAVEPGEGEREVRRSVYVIDKDGKVAFAARDYPTTEEIVGALRR